MTRRSHSPAQVHSSPAKDRAGRVRRDATDRDAASDRLVAPVRGSDAADEVLATLAATEPPPAAAPEERRKYLMSDAFADRVTEHVRRAARKAVAVHQEAGLVVHGEIEGVPVEIPPGSLLPGLPRGSTVKR